MDTAKLLDDFLFAPSRYLTDRGDVVGAGFLMNSFSSAANKVGALACIGLGLAAVATGDTNLVGTAVAGVVINAMGGTGREGRQAKYYFDTKPDRYLPISPDMAGELLKTRDSLPFRIAFGAAAASGISAAITTIFQDTLSTGLVLAAIGTTVTTTDAISTWWRADRALDGHWNVLDQKPQPETKQSKMSEIGLPSSPSISN